MPDISSILGLLDSSRPEDQKAGLLALRAFAKQYARNIRPLYHVIPWSGHIVSEEAFRDVYAHTIELTGGLRDASTELLAGALRAYPPSLMVFRLMSAYQWAELADIIEIVRGVRSEATSSSASRRDSSSSPSDRSRLSLPPSSTSSRAAR